MVLGGEKTAYARDDWFLLSAQEIILGFSTDLGHNLLSKKHILVVLHDINKTVDSVTAAAVSNTL